MAAVLIGGCLGLLFGGHIPERMRQTVIAGMGLFIAALGVKLFLETQNAIVVLGSLLLGSILGEWWQIEDRLSSLGTFLEQNFTPKLENTSHGQSSNFVRGFLTASLIFCIGPIAILGAIQDGLTGNYQLLVIKSVLDGFSSLAFTSTLGIGVLFSVLPILIYQGSISLLAEQMQALMSEAMIAEMTAVGGVLLLGIAISSMLEIKTIRVGNFLPALFIAPLVVSILAAFGIQL